MRMASADRSSAISSGWIVRVFNVSVICDLFMVIPSTHIYIHSNRNYGLIKLCTPVALIATDGIINDSVHLQFLSYPLIWRGYLFIFYLIKAYVILCGLAWRARRPLSLEIADMREAKLEWGAVAVSSARSPTKKCRPTGLTVVWWQTGGFVTLPLLWVPV